MGGAERKKPVRRGKTRAVRARPLIWRLVGLCAAVTLPLIAVVALLLNQYAQSARDELDRAGLEAVRSISEDLDRDMAALTAILETLSHSTRISAQDYAGFHELASAIARNTGLPLLLSDLSGQQVVNTRVPFGSELPRLVGPLDDAIISRKPVISDLFMGAVSLINVFSIAAPVFSPKSGEVEFLLSFSIDPVRVRNVLLAASLGPHAYAGVIDRNGRMLARTVDHEKYLGTTPQPFLTAIGDRREGQARLINRDGQEILASFTRMKSTDWIVAYGLPVQVVDEPVHRVRQQVLVLGLLTVLIVSAAGFVFSQRIVDALASLGSLASDVGQGRIVAPVRTSVTEINEVGQRLARASHDLRETTEAKDSLLYEVNHRVKNSLAVITSLLAMHVRQTPDEGLKRGLEDLRRRIDVIASVHQKLYESGRHDRLDLGSFLHDIAVELTHALGGSHYRLISDCEEGIIVGVDRTTPLALIVGELLTNAVKHGVGDAAHEIRLTVKRVAPGRIMVAVADDGPGLPADFDRLPPAGMGMRIISGLVRQVRGQLTTNAGEPGARFEIILKEALA